MAKSMRLPPDVELLEDGSKPGGWWHQADKPGQIVCDVCPRNCSLKPGQRGFCFVRQNRDGQAVLTTYGKSTGFCIDPIEKKPLNHFYPGTSVLSFGTAGCNLGCKFCQNWSMSKSREVQRLSETASPETIAEAARQLGCRSVAFTYNDPIPWAEYAIDTARECRSAGVKTVAVTSAYMTPESRGPFYESMDAANVDLKAFTERFYRQLTLSHLAPVLDTIEWLARDTDVWFELTNLVIPTENDSPDELRQMCDWVLERVGDEVPIHFSAFHPDFRMMDHAPTPPATLLAARDIAIGAGLKYVYVGNVDDEQHQSTYCPHCGDRVIQRNWYELGRYELDGDRCGHCGGRIRGRFQQQPGVWGRQRRPVRISQYARAATINSADTPATQGEQKMADEKSAPAPEVNDQQKAVILRTACEVVASAIRGTSPELPDPDLAGAGGQSVLGSFVTLKRKGRLRACCGFFGRKAQLLDAIQHAATQTATADVRLPPISFEELEYLDVDVWLLHEPKTVAERGEDRVSAIIVGRHGLQIRRGDASGLLLPGVAVDAKMDAEQFLQAVCQKAGLPPTAWKEDDTQLLTFEGVAVEGPFATDALAEPATGPSLQLSEPELKALAAFCHGNVLAFAQGATPSYYAAGCPDGTVEGICLSMHLDGDDRAGRFAKMSLRPGIPLQATLSNLAEAAGKAITARGVYPIEPDKIRVEVSILSDPAMHGTVSQPDLRGVDTARRALLSIEAGKSAWVFDPEKTPDELLQTVRSEAKIVHPESAGVFSLAVRTTETPVRVVNVPRGRPGPAVRAPAVAGMFYPGKPEKLAEMVDDLLAGAPPPRAKWAAAMIPHAGLIYSGRIAADVLRRVEMPDSAIIFCPKHSRMGVDWAVAPYRSWQTPGGDIGADVELTREMVAAVDGLELDASAHEHEHAIEVQLPLLARLAPDMKIVGVALGPGSLDPCRRLAEQLAAFLKEREKMPLLVISTDMNHYASDVENRRLDEIAMTALESLDPGKLFDVVQANKISMCGMLPAVVVLDTLRRLGLLDKCERVAYDTSAATSRDETRVVGYAGMLFG